VILGGHARTASHEMREVANDCRTLLEKAGVEARLLLRRICEVTGPLTGIKSHGMFERHKAFFVRQRGSLFSYLILFNNCDQLALDPPRAHELMRRRNSIFDSSELIFGKAVLSVPLDPIK
jgi:hypothetical protein